MCGHSARWFYELAALTLHKMKQDSVAFNMDIDIISTHLMKRSHRFTKGRYMCNGVFKDYDFVIMVHLDGKESTT